MRWQSIPVTVHGTISSKTKDPQSGDTPVFTIDHTIGKALVVPKLAWMDNVGALDFGECLSVSGVTYRIPSRYGGWTYYDPKGVKDDIIIGRARWQ